MELALGYGFAAIALLVSLSFAWIRHPIHAALSFACAVLAAAGICLLQDAAFVAAALVIVYAGATIIIFLFALMFAHQGKLSEYDLRMENPGVAAIAAIGLAIALLVVPNTSTLRENVARKIAADTPQFSRSLPPDVNVAPAPVELAKPKFSDFGREFYTRYLLAVEVAGTLLLVATIGSVLIAQRETPESAMKEEAK
jgi:NADH-quinone oxidoreductase subunit J